MDCGDQISDSVQGKFMAAIDNLDSMPTAAAAWFLRLNDTLVRAIARAAARRSGALLR
jgi:hypothetical protein